MESSTVLRDSRKKSRRATVEKQNCGVSRGWGEDSVMVFVLASLRLLDGDTGAFDHKIPARMLAVVTKAIQRFSGVQVNQISNTRWIKSRLTELCWGSY